MTQSLVLPFGAAVPRFAHPLRSLGPRAAILGRVSLGADVHLGADCVLRGDGHDIRLGDDVWLGARTTLHIVHGTFAAVMGSHVTVGANACVHACTLGDHIVVDHDVMILDGAVIGDSVVIEAGSTVFPRKVLAGGWIYAGSPAKALRPVELGEVAQRAAQVRAAPWHDAPCPPAPDRFGAAVFVARTAQGAGALQFAPGSSLFFSCVADAGTGAIHVGANTNIQDNTVLRVGEGTLDIGSDTSIGHNVRIASGRIGARSLIGIGADLAPGTQVADDVFVAAGATTEPGQVLDSGWLWAGRPAKPLQRLTDARRHDMRRIVETYREYSQAFRLLQQTPLSAPLV